MNTFADLMNLLLCFFVMLFAMSSIDAEKYDEIRDSFTSDSRSFLSGGLGILDNGGSSDEYSIVDGENDEEVEKFEEIALIYSD